MIQIYTDGASSGNPGLSGAGILIKSIRETKQYSIPLGLFTNHEAEFYAVIEALLICEADYPNKILAFHSDSQLVVEAIEKQFVKKGIYRALLKEIQQKSALFPYFFIKWIPRKENPADQLAKDAIHLNSSRFL